MNLYLAQSSELSDDPGEVLCFSWQAYAAAQARGLSANAWERWFPEDLSSEALAKSQEFAELWYSENGRDATIFEGVSLGKAYRWLFWALNALPAFRFIGALDHAVRRHAPSVVRCETSLSPLYRRLLESASGPYGFAIEWIQRPQPDGDIDAWTPPVLTMPPAKRRIFKLTNALGELRPARKGPLVWASYYHSMEPVFEELDRAARLRWVLADPPPRKRLPRLLANGWRVMLDSWTQPAWGGGAPAEILKLKNFWLDAKRSEAYRRAFVWRGVELFDAFEPALDDFFTRQVEGAAWATRELQRAWDRDRPEAVLLPYDTPPFQSLLAIIAAGRGKPAIGVLHGFPFDVGMPFTEDCLTHLLVWGDEQKRAYESAKPQGSCRFIALGNPLFDRYVRPPAPAPAEAPRPLRVLALTRTRWFSSLLGRSEIESEQYALLLARTMAGLSGARLSLRLHPSESPAYYRELLKDHPSLTLLQKEPLTECLLDADLVIGSFTSVLLEAMALGRAVLCVNFSRLPDMPPFDGSWGAVPLTDAEQLRVKLEAILADPERELAALRAPQKLIVEKFAGPIDGRSAERTAAEIDRLVRTS